MTSRITKRLTELLNDSTASVEEVATVISGDPPAAAQVLRAANSPYYGFHRTISSVRDASCLIGMTTLRTMLRIPQTPSAVSFGDSDRMERVATHSRAVAHAAKIVARRVYFPNRDKVYAAGLLHDIGKFVIASGSAREQSEIDRLIRSYRIPATQAEMLVLGSDHAAIGASVLNQWDLPSSIVEAVRLHHHPTRSENALDLCGIVSLANIIAHRAGLGVAPEVYELDPVLLDYFGLSRASIETMEHQLEDLWPDSEAQLEMSSVR
ncbi:MAG: HDOD domain-containing protein [Capsulimonadaceae bacterium]|nr:HDOD domain-containing protein [Capsulimonadaceae bacterium]